VLDKVGENIEDLRFHSHPVPVPPQLELVEVELVAVERIGSS
jgi:hypothetical protein